MTASSPELTCTLFPNAMRQEQIFLLLSHAPQCWSRSRVWVRMPPWVRTPTCTISGELFSYQHGNNGGKFPPRRLNW